MSPEQFDENKEQILYFQKKYNSRLYQEITGPNGVKITMIVDVHYPTNIIECKTRENYRVLYGDPDIGLKEIDYEMVKTSVA